MKPSKTELDQQILNDYQKAEIINPPVKLPKIYNCPEQTDETKLNLAISYSYLLKNKLRDDKKGVQLFEIPPTEDNCQAYCGLGYEYKAGGCGDEWWNPDNSWTELPDTNDVSCHKGYEKVFQYGGHNNHLARQWGDGTIMHKMGCTGFGASPVYRVVESNHPYIVHTYGQIEKIWIKPLPPEVPKPYLRWQSTHCYDYVGSAYGCYKSDTRTREEIKAAGDNKWQQYYDEMKHKNVSVTKLNATLFNKTKVSQPEEKNVGYSLLNNLLQRLTFT